MRADRLVSLVLLLRQRGRMTAPALARELEVSTRTILRDIDALSFAGVPVYAERGRHGGFALLPGFRAELMGLNQNEALALLAAVSHRGEHAFGLGPDIGAATRKVRDAIPEHHLSRADAAARRLLIDPQSDLLARRPPSEDISAEILTEVRNAVLTGRRLRIHYAAADRPPSWRVVDPIGLVAVREKGYLLATVSGADRTYRLSRILAAEELDEPAVRPASVDLEQLWSERSARFRAGADQVAVTVLLVAARREELAGTAVAIHAERPAPDGRILVDAVFQDLRHAEWSIWTLGEDAEALTPPPLRTLLGARARRLAARYEEPASP